MYVCILFSGARATKAKERQHNVWVVSGVVYYVIGVYRAVYLKANVEVSKNKYDVTVKNKESIKGTIPSEGLCYYVWYEMPFKNPMSPR